MDQKQVNRRPIASRDTNWARKAAAILAKNGVSPNTISVLSVVFALGSLWMFYLVHSSKSNHALYLLLAVAAIQLRLLMNLFDGMIAVEYNKKSAVGGLYNEVPDRISDTLTIFGIGLVVKNMHEGMDLAYLAVALSIATAYIRTLGASLGCGHTFAGPMAKQHRMALICLGCIVTIWYPSTFFYVLIIMNAGLLITCYNRLSKITSCLNNAANQ